MTAPLAVAIVSGGMDSVVLAHHLAALGYRLSLLSFDYGQRHRKELGCAVKCADRLDAMYKLVDLSGLRALLPGSSLTDSTVEVPKGHYAAPSMSATVVPNRNAIMLAVAFGHAQAIGAKVVGFAAHGGDHHIYPDCRPTFVAALREAFAVGMDLPGGPVLVAPFVDFDKTRIAALGAKLGVPFKETWSCYEGREFHCGKCGTCVERQEAFRDAGVTDPTTYEA